MFGAILRALNFGKGAKNILASKKEMSFGAALGVFVVGILADSLGAVLTLFGIGMVLDPFVITPLAVLIMLVFIVEGGGSIGGFGFWLASGISALPLIGGFFPSLTSFGIYCLLTAKKSRG